MKMHIHILLCLIVGLAGSASADLIVGYDLENHSSSDSTLAATPYAEGVSATEMTAEGVKLLKNYGDGIFTASQWGESSQPDPKDYYEWSITADDGHAIEYDAIDLSLVRGHYKSVHGPESWELRASTDGFDTSDIALQSWDISDSKFDSIQTFLDQDISALGTQEGTVTFRLYGYNADGKGDFSGLAYSHPDLTGVGTNVNVYGNVIPEPATLSLLAIGGAGLLLRRRMR